MSFKVIDDFEDKIAEFYGSPYAVAVDCCTHAIELCLRYKEVKKFTITPYTYPSIPGLAKKIGIEFEWKDEEWEDYYYLGGTNIIDAAVLLGISRDVLEGLSMDSLRTVLSYETEAQDGPETTPTTGE